MKCEHCEQEFETLSELLHAHQTMPSGLCACRDALHAQLAAETKRREEAERERNVLALDAPAYRRQRDTAEAQLAERDATIARLRDAIESHCDHTKAWVIDALAETKETP